MRTKRVPVPQAMTALVGEKKKRPEGKFAEEPPVIACNMKELNHVLDKWIGDGNVRPFTVSRPPTEEERKNPLFCRIHNYVKHSVRVLFGQYPGLSRNKDPEPFNKDLGPFTCCFGGLGLVHRS